MIRRSFLAPLIVLSLLTPATLGAEAPFGVPADPEAAYTATITARSEKHVGALKLDDPAKAARVRDTIVKQYRALRDLHDARDAKLKDLPKGDAAKSQADEIKAQSEAALKKRHEEFLAELSKELNDAQVETIKDEMTYNVVKITYDGFLDLIPKLTEAQKAYILAQLKEAREIAMDKGSSQEKHGVFGKYKGRINNYLSKEGYDLKQLSNERNARLKARPQRDASTQSAK